MEEEVKASPPELSTTPNAFRVFLLFSLFLLKFIDQ